MSLISLCDLTDEHNMSAKISNFLPQIQSPMPKTLGTAALEGFLLISYFGYKAGSEGKSPKCDIYGEKKLTGVIILPSFYPKMKKKVCL